MVAAKAQDVDRIVARPPAGVFLYLVHGPDGGLVAERAAALAAASADPADPFSLIRLEAQQLAADPSRLADEAYAVSMFGGRRAILVRDAGSRPTLVAAVAALLKAPPPETVVVLEAGDLKKTHQLRTLVEREKTAAYALPCFVDDDAAVGRLIDDETRAAGLSISADAKASLIAHLGGDRLVTRAEVRKLCLYAHGSARIELADVEELIGDASGIGADAVVDLALSGDLPALVSALARATREGVTPEDLARTALREVLALDALRAEVDAGRRPEDVVEGARPPVFFKRKPRVIAALKAWSGPRLDRAVALAGATVRDARLDAALSEAIVGDMLVTLARVAASGRGR